MDARLQQPHTETWIEWAQARPIVAAAAVVAIGGAATILGALYFQYVLGYRPCPLCLEQRYPYYFGIPLAVFILLGTPGGSSPMAFGLGAGWRSPPGGSQGVGPGWRRTSA